MYYTIKHLATGATTNNFFSSYEKAFNWFNANIADNLENWDIVRYDA